MLKWNYFTGGIAFFNIQNYLCHHGDNAPFITWSFIFFFYIFSILKNFSLKISYVCVVGLARYA